MLLGHILKVKNINDLKMTLRPQCTNVKVSPNKPHIFRNDFSSGPQRSSNVPFHHITHHITF